MDLLTEFRNMPVHALRRLGRRFGVGDTSLPAYNNVVVGWKNRVVAGGGDVPSISTLNVLNTFYNGLLNAGIASLMVNVNCFVPDNLQAALTPLIAVSGNGSPTGTNVNNWINTNFVAGDLSTNGLKGNASNKYLKSGVIPSACLGAQSAGITLYNTFSEITTNVDISVTGTPQGQSQIMLLLNYTGYGTFFDVYNDTTGRINSGGGSALAGGVGYCSGNRTDSTTSYVYKATSAISHVAIAGPGGTNTGGAVTKEIYVYCQNTNGSPTLYVAKQFSFVAIHFGLTAAQSSILFNLVQAMRISFGGGYV